MLTRISCAAFFLAYAQLPSCRYYESGGSAEKMPLRPPKTCPCSHAHLTCTVRLDVVSLSHVYRSRPEPELAARHPPARKLPRERQGAEAHLVQPLRLADSPR